MALALTAALILPFTPHTTTELEQWSNDWQNRAVENLTVELMNERRDMHERHLWFFDPQPEEVRHRDGTRPDVAAPPPTTAGVEQWRSLVAAYFPPEAVDRMLRIMECESHGNPAAKNPNSSATGLFQIMAFWQTAWPGDYTDPWVNVSVAYQIWLEQGYGAWVCK